MKSEEKNWKLGNWSPPTIREGREGVFFCDVLYWYYGSVSNDFPWTDPNVKFKTDFHFRRFSFEPEEFRNLSKKETWFKCVVCSVVSLEKIHQKTKLGIIQEAVDNWSSIWVTRICKEMFQWESIYRICYLNGRNFCKFFSGHFAGINFRKFGLTEDFAGISFREWSLAKDFAGINFRETLPTKISRE